MIRNSHGPRAPRPGGDAQVEHLQRLGRRAHVQPAVEASLPYRPICSSCLARRVRLQGSGAARRRGWSRLCRCRRSAGCRWSADESQRIVELPEPPGRDVPAGARSCVGDRRAVDEQPELQATHSAAAGACRRRAPSRRSRAPRSRPVRARSACAPGSANAPTSLRFQNSDSQTAGHWNWSPYSNADRPLGRAVDPVLGRARASSACWRRASSPRTLRDDRPGCRARRSAA